MNYKFLCFTTLTLLSTFFFSKTSALESSPVLISEIPRLSSSITVDGELSENSWQQALAVELNYEVTPGENSEPAVKTTALIYEDGVYLYVAFKAFDTEPNNIRAYLSDRDDLWKSDYVSISMDTFNDSRKAYLFHTNAIGVQADSIFDEITGKNDIGWDGIWTSAAKLTNTGYIVEMSIPFKSLRFKNNQESKQWNIKFSRTWIRDVKYEFSSVRDDRNKDCSLCQFQPFTGFQDSQPTKNLTIIPALTLSKTDSRDVFVSEPWQNGELEDRESLDIRWGINQNLFLNATINPDFSQVEADEIQLEINKRFAVFTPEKRSFFLDGADYFSNWSRLVYTRLFAEPKYGLKLTGKTAEHSYGFMALEDKDTRFLLPDSQSSKLISLEGKKSQNQMFRYRYDLDESSNIGFTYTNRNAEDYSNKMFSVDGKYWFNDSNSLKFQLMGSETVNPDDIGEVISYNSTVSTASNGDKLNGSAYSVNFSHATRDWGLYLYHYQFGKDFRADSGFVSKSNWRSSIFNVERNWYPSSQDLWWKSATFDLQWQKISDLDGNSLNNKQQLAFIVSGVFQSEVAFAYSRDEQNYVQQRYRENIAPALFENEYPIDSYQFSFYFTPIAGIDLGIDAEWGDEIDFSTGDLGKVTTLIPNIEYQLNDHWNITLEYINQELEVDNQSVFDIQLVNSRIAYQINVNSFLRFTVQGSKESSNRLMASQLLYSYQINPFTLFYFGYSDRAIDTEQLQQIKTTDRTLFMKFSYAFQP